MATIWSLPNSLSHLPSTQRVGVLVELPRIVHGLGVDLDAICRELAIDPALFADMENQIEFAKLGKLLLACADASHQPDFGLIIGSAARARHLGPVGRLLASSANHGEMLRDFVSNHRLYVRGAGPYLMTWPEDGLFIGYRTHDPAQPGARIISAAAVAFGYHVFRELTEVEPSAIFFSHGSPPEAGLFRKTFGRAKLRFEAEHFGLLYRSASLAQPVVSANAGVHAALSKQISEGWASLEPDIRDQVLRILFPALLSGEPSLAEVAAKLQLTPRTLNRRLNARGAHFREILNAARLEIARQMLRDTGMTISHLSRTLGYSEVSAFTRFFAAMTGEPPSQWRAKFRPSPPEPITRQQSDRCK